MGRCGSSHMFGGAAAGGIDGGIPAPLVLGAVGLFAMSSG